MPLVQYSSCSQCNGMTWHEYVSRGANGQTYWLCRECGDRRAAERITLGPRYACHVGKIQSDHLVSEVSIIDISVLGARLQVLDPGGHMPEKGDTLLFNPRLQPTGPLGVYHRAKVRWTKGTVCGVAFTRAIFASAADLKRIVKS